MEIIKVGKKKISPNCLSLPNQKNNNNNNCIVVFYIWKKYNEILLTNNKMDLNNLKMMYHPPSPVRLNKTYILL